MDPITLRTISHIAVFIGSALALFGGIGTWYFGDQVEKLMPYRQPINVATVTVELIVESEEEINTHFMDRGGYLFLVKGQEALLKMSSQDSWGKQLGNGRVRYKGIFNMDAKDTGAGKPVNYLASAEFAQIFFHQIPMDKQILEGKAICTVNNTIRFEIDIPAQMPTKLQGEGNEGRVDNNLIFARDLKQAFKNIKP